MVRLYPKAAILAAFQRDPKSAAAFMAMLARQIMNLRTSLEQRNIHSARDRIRHYLAVNHAADGRSVLLTGTLKDLAANLGLTHSRSIAPSPRCRRMAKSNGSRGKSGSSSPYDPDHTLARLAGVFIIHGYALACRGETAKDVLDETTQQTDRDHGRIGARRWRRHIRIQVILTGSRPRVHAWHDAWNRSRLGNDGHGPRHDGCGLQFCIDGRNGRHP